MTEKLETCSAADFRDKWGRVTPKSLMNGDSKTKTFADGFVKIGWSADASDYFVSSYNGDKGWTLHFDGIRAARASYASTCRERLAKQHQPAAV